MNEYDIHLALNELDDDLIEEVDRLRRKQTTSKIRWIRFGVIAASVILVIVAGIPVYSQWLSPKLFSKSTEDCADEYITQSESFDDSAINYFTADEVPSTNEQPKMHQMTATIIQWNENDLLVKITTSSVDVPTNQPVTIRFDNIPTITNESTSSYDVLHDRFVTGDSIILQFSSYINEENTLTLQNASISHHDLS